MSNQRVRLHVYTLPTPSILQVPRCWKLMELTRKNQCPQITASGYEDLLQMVSCHILIFKYEWKDDT